jgi:hypothetical protein
VLMILRQTISVTDLLEPLEDTDGNVELGNHV